MFSWITGPRITNVIEDLQPENNYESTIIDEPETPAHQFAVNAFKHAIFGTPAAEDANTGSKRHERQAKINSANAKAIDLAAPKDDAPGFSPSKQPGGILMTPGTASKGRKTVSFGSQVVDNEGKRGNVGKSGIPNDCPGKFPSPWTPGTELKLDPGSDKRPRTRLTEALLDARTTTQPKSGQKPKAKDDSDITIDLGAPRSESGKYWKEQYESYAEKSEKEMKKVIAKQQLAKKFAMKKDSEVTELQTKFEQERKKLKQREHDLKQQNKDLQERLQQAQADGVSANIELATLKARLAVLEKSNTASMVHSEAKAPFNIFEDVGKETIELPGKQEKGGDVSMLPSLSELSIGKENKSPKPRRQQHQTLPETSNLPRLGTAEDEVSILLGKSPRVPRSFSTIHPEPAHLSARSELGQQSPPRSQRTKLDEKAASESQAAMPPSSPLPMPSPGIDPWMDLNNNVSISEVDKMAMPGFSGQPYTRPEWNPKPRQRRASKVAARTKSNDISSKASHQAEQITTTIDLTSGKAALQSSKQHDGTLETRFDALRPRADIKTGNETSKPTPHQSSVNSKHDASKITSQHVEEPSQIKKDRAETLPADRKEQARRRIEERRKARKNTPT